MTSRRTPYIVTVAVLAAFVVVLDQWTKHWVLQHFALHESRPITSFFALTFVHNTGTAFGLFQGNNKALLAVAFAVLGVLLYTAPEIVGRGGRWTLLGMGLVFGGAIGNMIDRFSYGYVLDFLDFHIWPVFNVADSAITLGALSLAIGALRREGNS